MLWGGENLKKALQTEDLKAGRREAKWEREKLVRQSFGNGMWVKRREWSSLRDPIIGCYDFFVIPLAVG